MKTILTGIKPTGEIHLGNYLGAIKPAVQLSTNKVNNYAYFIADLHALNNDKIRKEGSINELSLKIACTFIALGLDIERCLLYRQSDIPYVTELAMYLMNDTPKGLLNRAHAYKAKTSENIALGMDMDSGVNMGLYNYPVLMAADILLMDTDEVPVGKDQLQHIEITRDIAVTFNHRYGELFKVPKALVEENTMILPGNDGRKMSKSYGNTIQLFSSEKELEKQIMKIKTASVPLGEKIPTEDSVVYELYKALLDEHDMKAIDKQFENGIGYGKLKKQLFEVMNEELKDKRQKYFELLDHPEYIESILKRSNDIVNEKAATKMKLVKDKIFNA